MKMKSLLRCLVGASLVLASGVVASAGMITTGVSVVSQVDTFPVATGTTTDTASAYDSPTSAVSGAATASLAISAPVFDPIAGTITYTGVASSTGTSGPTFTDVSQNKLSLDLTAECDFDYTFTANVVVNDSGAGAAGASLNLFVITRANTSNASDFGQPDNDPLLNLSGSVAAGDTPTFGFTNRNQDDSAIIGPGGGDFDYAYTFELVFSNAAAGCVCSVPEPSSFLFLGMIGMVGFGWKRFVRKSDS